MNTSSDGVYVRGRFLGVTPRAITWTDKESGEKRTGEKASVSLLVGKGVIYVEFFNTAAAHAAIGASKEGEPVEVRVFINSYVTRNGEAKTSYRGPSLPRSGEVAA